MHTQFSTTDIILAAVLKVKGHEMIEILRNGNKVSLVFSDIHRNAISEFDLGKTLVEPTSFNTAIKQLTTSVRRI